MSMKWMGGPNHILRHVPSENPTQIPTSYYWPTPFWSDGIVWCCGNMAASHSRRLLSTVMIAVSFTF